MGGDWTLGTMRQHRGGLSGLAILLAVLSALLAGCAPEGPGHLIVYAPAGSIIAAAPPAGLLVKLPDGSPTLDSYGDGAPPTLDSYGDGAPPTLHSYGDGAPPTLHSYGDGAPPTLHSYGDAIAMATERRRRSIAMATERRCAPRTSFR